MVRNLFVGVVLAALVAGSVSVAVASPPSSDSRPARGDQIVVSTTSPRKVNSGTAVPLTVKLPKAAAGAMAVLQTRRPGTKKWQGISKAPVPKSRTLKLSPRAAGGGTHAWRIRVRLAATRVLTSNVVRVTAYAWYWLSDLDTITQTKNWYKFGTVAIGGKPYRNTVGSSFSAASFGGWMSGKAEYNLSYRCLRFNARIGLPDDSGSLAQWHFATTVDGTENDHGWRGIGGTAEIMVDVTGGFRIELSNARLDGDPWQNYEANAAWGSARLYCAGMP